jgi:DNA-binding CsgD family transcriptional regulator
LSNFLALPVLHRLTLVKWGCDDGQPGEGRRVFVNQATQMNAPAFVMLSEGQKACLRLVDDHHTSKEIARLLGISPFTVDQRLDAARRKLNAATRKDAAKIFASFEKGILSEPFVYEPQRIEPVEFGDILTLPPNRVEQLATSFFSLISVPPIGGERHELPKRDILVQSLNIAFFSTLVIAFVVIVLTGTLRLFE